jgi:hypothetical protein
LVVANHGGTGGVLKQELSSQPVVASAYPFNPQEAFSPYTVIHMFSKNFKESQDLAKTAACAPRIFVQSQFSHYYKVHGLITVLPFEGTVKSCLQNSCAGEDSAG